MVQRLKLFFPFLMYIFGICDLGLAHAFWDRVIEISNKTDEKFNIYFLSYEKLKTFVKTFTPYTYLLMFLHFSLL